MNNFVRVEKRVPKRLCKIKEYSGVYKSVDTELDSMYAYLNKLKYKPFHTLCDIEAVARYEKMYNIIPEIGDSIGIRRDRILSVFLGDTPYTKISIEAKLNTLIGAGKYDMKIEDYYLRLRIGDIRDGLLNTIKSWIAKIKPCNIVCDIKHYRTYDELEPYTYDMLERYTYDEIYKNFIEIEVE